MVKAVPHKDNKPPRTPQKEAHTKTVKNSEGEETHTENCWCALQGDHAG